jgi:hypothetical protein
MVGDLSPDLRVGDPDRPQYQVHHHFLAVYGERKTEVLKFESHCYQIGLRVSHLKGLKLTCSEQDS